MGILRVLPLPFEASVPGGGRGGDLPRGRPCFKSGRQSDAAAWTRPKAGYVNKNQRSFIWSLSLKRVVSEQGQACIQETLQELKIGAYAFSDGWELHTQALITAERELPSELQKLLEVDQPVLSS